MAKIMNTRYDVLFNGKTVLTGIIEFKPNSTYSFSDILGNKYSVPQIKRVVFEQPRTIVFWQDGSSSGWEVGIGKYDYRN